MISTDGFFTMLTNITADGDVTEAIIWVFIKYIFLLINLLSYSLALFAFCSFSTLWSWNFCSYTWPQGACCVSDDLNGVFFHKAHVLWHDQTVFVRHKRHHYLLISECMIWMLFLWTSGWAFVFWWKLGLLWWLGDQECFLLMSVLQIIAEHSLAKLIKKFPLLSNLLQ